QEHAGALAIIQEAVPEMGWWEYMYWNDLGRQRAIALLATLASPTLREPQARQALYDMAEERNMSPSSLLREAIFPASVLVVLGSAYTPQRIQLGRQRRKDDAGLWAPMVPAMTLALTELVPWFQQQLYRAAGASMRGIEYPPDTLSIEAHDR